MARSFQRLGGSYLPVVESSVDLDGILSLEESQWASTSAPVDSINCDREFLLFIDDDANGRIRTDEIKRSLSWLLKTLKDRSGIDSGASVLKLSAIDPSGPDGVEILASAKLVLEKLGLPDNLEVSLSQIRARQNAISDGVFVADSGLSSFVKDIVDAIGRKSAGGGDREMLDHFINDSEASLKWLSEAELPNGAQSSSIMPFGQDSHEMFKLISSLRPKLDEFFTCCKAFSMGSDSGPGRFGRPSGGNGLPNVIDSLDAKAMSSFLESAPLAEPSKDCALPLLKGGNPLWQDKLELLSKNVMARAGMDSSLLTLNDWTRLKSLFAPYESWLKGRNLGLLEKLGSGALSERLGPGMTGKFSTLVGEALSVAKETKACDKLRKLILYQANFLEFCNNFVTLKSLFNPERSSMIQAGCLVMDGRHFTLATRVSDIDEHKKIAVRSDICIMYLDISTGPKDKLQTMKIAVGVTSGFMGNLYVGKNGVFFTPDGIVWDAKIVDLLSQPVSFSEALRMPFYKVGEFMGKQAGRFFSDKGKEIEDKAGQIPVAAAPPPSKQSSMNGSMLLMGGGVGLAALASSFAFIAQTLGNFTLSGVCTLLVVVMLIFGGPVLVVSVYKLWRRNIAMFLEAGGWALNEPLRMTRKMGLIFTHKPELPGGVQLLTKDLVNPFFKTLNLAPSKAKRWWKLIFFAVVAGLIAVLLFWLWDAGYCQVQFLK